MPQKEPPQFPIAIKFPIEISRQIIEDILCSAFEGGSNYWYLIVDQTKPDEDYEFVHQIPTRGGKLYIADIENPDDERWVLDMDAIQKGLRLMAKEYPRHFKDVITENGDAETGDVLLQLCLFGKMVFG